MTNVENRTIMIRNKPNGCSIKGAVHMNRQIESLRAIISQAEQKKKIISDLLSFARELEAHEPAEAEFHDQHQTTAP